MAAQPGAPPAGGVSALTAGDALLAHFWDLASLEEEARGRAAKALVEALVRSQQEHEAESEASDGEGGEATLRGCSPLVVYAFKRLCRGLGSSRQGARQGFGLAIASLLAATDCIGPAAAVAAIEGVLEPAGKGSDLRDALLGRIFGYAAVVRSGRPLPAAVATSMAAGLVAAATKKSFLRELAAAVLLELCEAVDAATLAGLVEGSVAPLAPWLHAPVQDATPEALLLALRLWPRLPPAVAAACALLPGGIQPKQLPVRLFADPAAAAGNKAVAAAAAAFFSRQHSAVLLPVLRATTAAHPRLHSVWPSLLALLLPGFSADKEQRVAGGRASTPGHLAFGALETFWSTVVDGDLVQSSHERKYLAFTLFLLLLPHLSPDQVPLVFTPAFLRCLATNLTKGDSHLHGVAKKCADRIAAYCDRAPEVRIAVALALQRHGGAELAHFATGGKAAQKGAKAKADSGTAQEASEAASAVALQQYVRELQRTFTAGDVGLEGGTSSGSSQQQRQWVVEQLCSVLKQRAAPEAVKTDVLHFLAVHALFSVDAAAAKQSTNAHVRAAAAYSVDIPLGLRRLCAARLIAQADNLDKQQQHQQQAQGSTGRHAGLATQLQPRHDYLGGVVELVVTLQQAAAVRLATVGDGEDEAAEAAQQAAGTLQQTLQRMHGQLQAESVDASKQQRLRALTHLLRLLLLHTLADPTTADVSLAADLDQVAALSLESSAAAQQRSPEAASSDEEDAAEPHWHDTLMDVLLSLLARNAAPLPSAPLRDAVEHVFRCFADDLTATGMADMLRVLAKPLDSSSQEDGDVYASSDEEDEEMEEAEQGEEAGEGSSSGEEEEQEEEEEEERPDTGAAAAAAAGSESESDGGAGSSSEDEEGMSDEAMFRMDAKLASYFATLKEGRGGTARTARDELVNFKMRVAGLLEAFCKRVPASPLLPMTTSPLLAGLVAASRPGGHVALAERLSGLITNKLCQCRGEAAGGGLEAAMLEQQLRRALYLASRSPDKRVAGAAWNAYIFLQRAACGAAASADCHAKGEESANAAATDFLTKKKTRLQRVQMEALLRRVPALMPALLPAMLQQAAAARNEHLRLEALRLLVASLKAGGSAVPKLLKSCGPAVAAAVTAAVLGPFAKPQRHLEAVAAACQVLESAEAAQIVHGKGGWHEARQATEQALGDASSSPKLAAALQRLEALLAEAPVGQGKRGKLPAGRAASAKKQKQSA